MNCANCANPRGKGSPLHLQSPAVMKLVKVEGGDEHHDKFQCPRCRAKFFFRK